MSGQRRQGIWHLQVLVTGTDTWKDTGIVGFVRKDVENAARKQCEDGGTANVARYRVYLVPADAEFAVERKQQYVVRRGAAAKELEG